MKIKNKCAVVGFVLAFANLGSGTALATESCHEKEGSLEIVTVNSGLTQVTSSADIAELYKNNIVNLSRSAEKTCSGRSFCIEDSTIKHEATSHNEPFIAYMNIKTVALVNCLK